MGRLIEREIEIEGVGAQPLFKREWNELLMKAGGWAAPINQQSWLNGASEAGWVGLVFLWWVMGGGTANGSAKGREPSQTTQPIEKRTKWNQSLLERPSLSEWIEKKWRKEEAVRVDFMEWRTNERKWGGKSINHSSKAKENEICFAEVGWMGCFCFINLSSAAMKNELLRVMSCRSSSAAALHSGSIPFFLHFGCFARSLWN